MAIPPFGKLLRTWVGTQTADLLPMVGGVSDMRVTPWQAPRKDPVSRVTFTKVSGNRVRGLGGPLGVTRQRWQLGCWGKDNLNAEQMVRLFMGNPQQGDQRLDGYLGVIGEFLVKLCVLEEGPDLSEPLGPGSDDGNPCLNIDVDIAFDTI